MTSSFIPCLRCPAPRSILAEFKPPLRWPTRCEQQLTGHSHPAGAFAPAMPRAASIMGKVADTSRLAVQLRQVQKACKREQQRQRRHKGSRAWDPAAAAAAAGREARRGTSSSSSSSSSRSGSGGSGGKKGSQAGGPSSSSRMQHTNPCKRAAQPQAQPLCTPRTCATPRISTGRISGM